MILFLYAPRRLLRAQTQPARGAKGKKKNFLFSSSSLSTVWQAKIWQL